jgi:hypothetical protein
LLIPWLCLRSGSGCCSHGFDARQPGLVLYRKAGFIVKGNILLNGVR